MDLTKPISSGIKALREMADLVGKQSPSARIITLALAAFIVFLIVTALLIFHGSGLGQFIVAYLGLFVIALLFLICYVALHLMNGRLNASERAEKKRRFDEVFQQLRETHATS